MTDLPACKDCKWWSPLVDTPESWGVCEYGFQFLPFWVKINPYGAISPNHYGCPTWEQNIKANQKLCAMQMIELRWLNIYGNPLVDKRVLQYRYKPDLPARYGDTDIAWSDWIDVPEVDG